VRSAQLRPAIRDLYRPLPETYHLQPWELQHVHFSLGYTDDLADEGDRCGRRGGERRLPTVEAGGMREDVLLATTSPSKAKLVKGA
jgi:hypothetical protein